MTSLHREDHPRKACSSNRNQFICSPSPPPPYQELEDRAMVWECGTVIIFNRGNPAGLCCPGVVHHTVHCPVYHYLRLHMIQHRRSFRFLSVSIVDYNAFCLYHNHAIGEEIMRGSELRHCRRYLGWWTSQKACKITVPEGERRTCFI